ncbi:TIGR04219 family outer membrane beta-barrel protein [Sulfurimonas sp.]|jgi:outer membrane protein|uniref:TIGR04219 family outer membrane beta-barrel protein n=1 Tax=Sulfurimonas sp. TaxID=2022749 RepID=UPI0025DD1D50|nr:TIGR04219 family outer membrane beta-barrel protein [Sulfurimonas sp.]MBT5935804.1 TIGR04219 family outer membrane beta-barrel protein [Sulfurimonas sp.]
MKKVLSLLAFGLMLTTTLSADFLRAEVGAGVWAHTPTGGLESSQSGATGSDVSSETQQAGGYAWLLVKHFVPVIPNLRLEYANVTSEGEAIGTFAGFSASAGKSTLEMTQYDIIPYYNILDNTFWLTLDLGIDLKMVNVDYSVAGVTLDNAVSGTEYDKVQMLPIPMVYVRTRLEIPMSDLAAEADVKYISYDSTTIYDARVKVDYTIDITPLIQPAIEVGYRVQKFETGEAQDVDFKLDFAGIYAGLILRF